MTAFSTIFGMIPVALATSDAAELRNPMGVLVIGGLSSSTLLTLLVVPVAYTLLADLRIATARPGKWVWSHMHRGSAPTTRANAE